MNPFAGQSIKKVMRPAVYIAGPFFNKRQQQLIMDVEEFLKLAGYDYYSPYSSQGREFKKIETPAVAEAIFMANVREIEECDVVLAVLDYLLPEDQRLCVVRGGPVVAGYTPVKVPDSGTIWEIGFAYGKRMPIVGLTMQSKATSTLNLMMTQSLSAVCYGFEDLKKTFLIDMLTLGNNPGWEGRYI